MSRTASTRRRPAGADTSLGRGLEILLALGRPGAGENGGAGVVRIAERVGREKTQVSRALRTLAEYGFVDRDPKTRDYRLGWRLFALAAQTGPQHMLEQARQICEQLVERLGETAHLSVLDGADVVTLMSRLSPSAVHARDGIGRRTPAHCTASGRALLLEHDAAQLASLFLSTKLPTPGPNAPRSVAELGRRIQAAREAGFAVTDEEYEAGLVSVAAPVRDFRGEIVAALNVSGPKFRSGTELEASGPTVREAADELSRRVGWGSAPVQSARGA